MTKVIFCGLLAALAPASAQQPDLSRLLDRLAAEADAFLQLAPKVVSQETLVQRARHQPHRRLHLGAPPPGAGGPEFQTREIISEYSFAALKDSPRALREFRQVISVDGRHIATEAKARRSLASGIESPEDAQRKRMLESFEKYGLTGAAADFGQLILMFSKRRQADYDFRLAGQDRLGADTFLKIAYKQKAGTGGLLVFERNQAHYEPLEGEIWSRKADGLPMRILIRSQRDGIRDEARVDYVRSPHGLQTPVSVVHRQFNGQELNVENIFRYAPFRLFSAESELKF